MYIIEKIIKIIKTLKNKKSAVNKNEQEEDFSTECENHIYLPIDSSKEYLACKNCGHIIKNPKTNPQ